MEVQVIQIWGMHAINKTTYGAQSWSTPVQESESVKHFFPFTG